MMIKVALCLACKHRAEIAERPSRSTCNNLQASPVISYIPGGGSGVWPNEYETEIVRHCQGFEPSDEVNFDPGALDWYRNV